jgi:hypothetical protein
MKSKVWNLIRDRDCQKHPLLASYSEKTLLSAPILEINPDHQYLLMG